MRKATVSFADAFDAALLSAADAPAFVAGATVIENSWAAMKALAAARTAERGDRGPAGQRRAAEELARTTGTSLGVARTTIDIGRRMQDQSEVAAAARRGELSPAQTSAITDAAAVDPAAESRLVDAAANGSLLDLRDECARTKAAVDLDPDKHHAEIRAGRRLRHWTDAAGVGHLHGSGNPEDIAQLIAAIAPGTDRLFQEARRAGRRESPDAYAFDALVELALDATSSQAPHSTPAAATAIPATATALDQTATAIPATATALDQTATAPGRRTIRDQTAPDHGCGPGGGQACSSGPDLEMTTGPRQRRGAPVKLHLRVDLDTWLRGFPITGEVCELVGYGPVPVSVVRKLVAQGDPFVTAILTKGQAMVGVAHLGRRPTAYQRSALEWLYPSCAVRGCSAQAHLQFDHRVDWAQTHFTLLDWLDRLCITHHNLKTRDGWALVDGIGKRPFVPPEDPRHPRHQGERPSPSLLTVPAIETGSTPPSRPVSADPVS